MADLLLVRHAQASFGTDDYDRLSELGHRQARWLGEYFAERDLRFDRVVSGTLRRHRETVAGIVAGGASLADPIEHAGLDEYHADRLMHAWLVHTGTPPPAPGADRREHFRVLRDALRGWVDARFDAAPHLPFEAFAAGARAGLELARADPSARRVLLVSSGGPIATLIGATLGAGPHAMVELNLQMRNSGFSEFRFTPRTVQCVSFNTVPHLDAPDRRAHVTYS